MAARKRIFIAFAKEDEYARDLLKGQARNSKTPFDFTDMSVKEAWDKDWKAKVRTRIKGCDGVVVLLSSHTRLADGEKHEMTCAEEEGIPMLGMHILAEDQGRIPPQLAGCKVIIWNWEMVEKFIESL